MKFQEKLLSVGCWNMEGIYEKVNGTYVSKLEDETFLKTLNKTSYVYKRPIRQKRTFRNLRNMLQYPIAEKLVGIGGILVECYS